MLSQFYRPTNHGRTIYVDAVNGSDTTGRAYSDDAPFATPAAAQAIAVSGDNIKVRPGSYTTTASLAKNGVDWDFDIGASVTRTNNTASGIWDDGNTAMTFQVTGSGTFNRVITSPVGNHGGVVWVRHASSNVFIQAFDLTMDSGPASTPAIDQRDGRLVIRCRNLTAIGDPLTTNVAAFWANGFFDVEGSLCQGQVWWEVVSAPTGDMHMRFTEFHPLQEDTFYDSSSRSDAAVWIHGNTMRSAFGKLLLTKQGVSRLYLTAQKFFGTISAVVPTTLETENFTANGNFTPDADVTTALFNVKAGAGGGGGSNDTLGGGGGGGGGQQEVALNLTPGSPVAIVVGAGGAGGAADTDGSSGDPSSATFGTAISSTGGSGGQSGTNGGAGGAGGTPDGTATGGNGDGSIGGAGGTNGLCAVGGNGGNPTPGGEAGLDGEDGAVLVSWEDPTLSRGKLYLIADKIDGRIQISNRHKVIIEIKDWEAADSNPFITVGTAGVNSAVVDVYGGYLQGEVNAASQLGGELRLHNVTLDTTASASVNPVAKSGGTLTLIDCTLLAESTRDSITASTAQTVNVWGTLHANRAVHANVTLATDAQIIYPDFASAISVVSNALSVATSNRISADNALSNAISAASSQISVLNSSYLSLVNRVSANSGVGGGGGSVTSNELSAASAQAASAINVVSNAVSVVSQAVSALSQAASVADAALSVRIDTQSQGISVLSQKVSTISQNVSVVSNAASNALSVANAASQAASVVSVALLSEISNRTSAVNVVSNAASVVSTAASNALSVANAASQAASVVSVALLSEISNRVSSHNVLSNAISAASSQISLLTSSYLSLVNRVSANSGAGGGGSVTSNEVSAVSAQAASAINVVSNAISVEISNRLSADNALSNSLSDATSVGSATAAELSNFLSALCANVSNLTSAHNALSNLVSGAGNLSDQVSVVSQAISVLSVAVNNLSNQVSAAGGFQQASFVTTGLTISGAALVSIPSLSISCAAGAMYQFEAMVMFDALTSGGGQGFGVSYPALAARGAAVIGEIFTNEIQAMAAITATVYAKGFAAFSSEAAGSSIIVSAFMSTINSPRLAKLGGIINTSAAGPLHICGRTSAAGAHILIRSGYVRAYRIG